MLAVLIEKQASTFRHARHCRRTKRETRNTKQEEYNLEVHFAVFAYRRTRFVEETREPWSPGNHNSSETETKRRPK
jgi:hypothetical protein